MTGIKYRLETITVPARDELFASPFCFRAGLPESKEDDLVVSISRHGIINPPIILSGACGTLRIVTGHRRLAAANLAGLKDVVVISVDAEMRDAVAHWIDDAGRGAPLSDLEKIVLVEIAGSLAGGIDEAFLPGLSALFGHEVTSGFAKRLTSLLSLDREILSSLHKGLLSTGDLLALEQHPSIETGQAAGVLAAEHLNRGSRKQAIRLISYLADQGGERLAEFMESRLKDGTPLIHGLRKACYPLMEKDLDSIRSIISGIGLPKGAAIHPPDNLEGGSYQFTLRIRNVEDARIASEKLNNAVEDGSIGRLLDILKGRGGSRA